MLTNKYIQYIKYVIKDLLYSINNALTQIKYCNGSFENDTKEKLLSSMVINYHTIEKGLTMPEKKPGFGIAKILTIVDLCNKYRKQYVENVGVENVGVANQKPANQRSANQAANQGPANQRPVEIRYKETIAVLKEYVEYHRAIGFKLEEKIQKPLNALLSLYPEITASTQGHYKKGEYFSESGSSFDKFSNSRHSIRNLKGVVEEGRIRKALEMAMNSPSTCNRQATRLYVVRTEAIKKEVLEIQSGNRGFGHTADALVVITSDLNDWLGEVQTPGPWIDGGIFTMNLLYALHFHKIGACTLNLYLTKDENNRLHQVLRAPFKEVFVALVAIGSLPEEFDVALSSRREYSDVTKFI